MLVIGIVGLVLLAGVVLLLAAIHDKAKTCKIRLTEIREQDRVHQNLVEDWWRMSLRNSK